MTPLKAIREKCLDCCCGQPKEVKLCPVTKCPLYEFRFGHTKREMSEEARQKARERMLALKSREKNQ